MPIKDRKEGLRRCREGVLVMKTIVANIPPRKLPVDVITTCLTHTYQYEALVQVLAPVVVAMVEEMPEHRQSLGVALMQSIAGVNFATGIYQVMNMTVADADGDGI